MPSPEEFEDLVAAMAASEPELTPEETDEDDNGSVAWYIAYTTFRN
ncbi:hypothetical protein [Sphaerisporangium aureirubrum]|uniref:Uncharacterized protein n=1 Tax=Sphaerisporangium aureirubrum TaxID=1544736 RepID=A0ABW1NUV8_9ACTN